MGAYTPAEFLARAEGKDLFPQYEWAVPVDLVFIGTCSEGLSSSYATHTLTEGKRPNKKFFDRYIEKYRPKKVLLISECCGTYSKRVQKEIRNMYPDVEWVIPCVPNYADWYSFAQLAADLACLGILRDPHAR